MTNRYVVVSAHDGDFSNRAAGSILPLLHHHTHEFRHDPRHIFAAEAEQRCALPIYTRSLVLTPPPELESTATRISSDFTPEHADLIEKQRKKQKRRERRIKRAIVSLFGWSVIAGMIYLIAVTARTVPKIWDPYEVLGVSRVSVTIALDTSMF